MASSPLTQLCDDLALRGGQIRTDSREVQPGDIFAALPGVVPGRPDQSAEHAAEALRRGAGTVVLSPAAAAALPGGPFRAKAALVVVDDPRLALGDMARALHHTAGLPFPLIGVTGTNGKTTCAYLLEHLYRSSGRAAGVLGTVSYRWPGHDEAAPLTTPGCLTIHEHLAAMRAADVRAAVMEVSSHALDQRRVAGLSFAGALFTNLTQDHLDYHGDMESYFQAKRRLFLETPDPGKRAAINADDAYGRRLLDDLPGAAGYGLIQRQEKRPFLAGELLSDSPEGLRLRLTWRDGEKELNWDLRSPLVGRHNAANLMAVMALALQCGFGPGDFACFHDFYGVSGRLERIPAPNPGTGARGAGVGIFVDYAHTPDALIRAQEALRDAGFARIITVFGCGGDRDRTKRPLMGRAVAEASDVAVVTSDNPRTEDPEAIIDDIMPGLSGAAEVHRQSDRRKALELALNLARPGDALLVAGKGHEPYQIIGTVKYPFSDQGILKELLSCA
ncbi:MAG: UDP-N-acetylmuramoyl-L-alanyl-D-glutamate--2,6-diaminopimelate ligase [Desulfovibrionaceae bacterium]|nr:UDP-N-acetylmuramoyl-L-alanyl-D-glutamate--2,6-diaminopimelate ligase [Desulfovibrionaceae bacterium]